MLSITGYFLHTFGSELIFGDARFRSARPTSIAKWMTLPFLSGNMSQL
jgi:hypothetical protein